MTAFRQYTFWSPSMGRAAVRVSVPDDHGREFFAILARDSEGRTWRERREAAIQAIEAAILRGDQPGEVRL